MDDFFDPDFDESMIEGISPQDRQQDQVLSDVEKRIEHANLYKALLEHDLFAPGSARPDIINTVKAEVRDFILGRLNALLGLGPAKSSQIEAYFSEEQVNVLRAMANKLIKGGSTVVNTAQVRTSPPVTPVQPKPAPKTSPVQKQVKSQPRKITESNKYTSVSPAEVVGAPRPIPMPSPYEMEAMAIDQGHANVGVVVKGTRSSFE